MNKTKSGKKNQAATGGAAKTKKTVSKTTVSKISKAQVPTVAMTVTFRHVEPTDAIRTYAQRKFAHVGKFLKRSCEAHLILTVDKYRQHGEITIKSKNLTLTAQEETKDLYSTIDLLADKVGRQLKSHTGKAKDKRVRAPSTGVVLSAAEEGMLNGGPKRL